MATPEMRAAAAERGARLEDYFRRDKSDLIEPEERKDSHVCYL